MTDGRGRDEPSGIAGVRTDAAGISYPPVSVAAGLVAAAVGLVAPGGPVGVAAAAVVFLAGVALPPWYAFAVGQFALAAVLSGAPSTGPLPADTSSLAAVLWVQAALFVVLLGGDRRSRRGRRLAAGTVAGTLLLVGIAAGAHLAWETAWATALVVAAVVAVAGYALHRYERVATGALRDASRDGSKP